MRGFVAYSVGKTLNEGHSHSSPNSSPLKIRLEAKNNELVFTSRVFPRFPGEKRLSLSRALKVRHVGRVRVLQTGVFLIDYSDIITAFRDSCHRGSNDVNKLLGAAGLVLALVGIIIRADATVYCQAEVCGLTDVGNYFSLALVFAGITLAGWAIRSVWIRRRHGFMH